SRPSRLRSPFGARGGNIIGGIGFDGHTHSPGVSGDTADASCTADCEARNIPTKAGGIVSLPIDTPTPTAAVGADSTALAALARLAAAPPSAEPACDRPWPRLLPTLCSDWLELSCAR